jgi:magnesium-transporting ATPase (P-type)
LSADRQCAIVIGGCHTLAFTDNNLVGDPLEKQSFELAKFKQAADGSRVSTGHNITITQIKKYLFNSTLKRMSVIAQINA